MTKAFRKTLPALIAAAAFSALVSLGSEPPDPAILDQVRKGFQQLEMGRPTQARKTFRRAVHDSRGREPAALLGLARVSLVFGDYDEAVERAEASKKLTDDVTVEAHAENYVGLASLHEFRERWQRADWPEGRSEELLSRAEKSFRRVLELTGGTSNSPRLSLALVLQYQGRYDDARAALDEYYAQGPAEAELLEAESLRCWLEDRTSERPARPVDAEVTPPVRLHPLRLRYPPTARNAGIQGQVVIEGLIDVDGSVRCGRVLRGLPGGLTEAALRAVRESRYRPAMADGVPVPVYYNLTVNFGTHR